jgi:hypothetical protein
VWEDVKDRELGRTVEKVVMVYFKIIVQNFPGTEKNHTQLNQLASKDSNPRSPEYGEASHST